MNDADGEPTDAALLERARSGDDQALDRLLTRHQGVAYRVALTIVRDPDEAADVVQNAMLKTLRGLDKYRGDARFRTWLLSIVVNEARAGLRRSGRRREVALEAAPDLAGGGPGVAESVVRAQEAARARAVLALLPEKQRLSVQMRIDEGLSYREIAAVIGSTEGAARVNYHHGVRRLRELLQEDS